MVGATSYTALLLVASCLVSKCSCNALIETRVSEIERQLEETKNEYREIKDEFSQTKNELRQIKEDINSLNQLFSKLVYTLLQEKDNDVKEDHVVEKREVISSIEDLPIEALAALRGRDGKDGVQGPSGEDGAPGRDGRDGQPGTPGLPGRAGVAGPRGVPGAQGPEGKPGGSVYTRWGRRTCGSNATLLYAGFAGGSNFDQSGGGVNYQCMPLDPQYDKSYEGHGTWHGSWVAGVEYQTYNYGIFPSSPHDQNAPCARCYANNRPALMMLPAKRECPKNWIQEYGGYLMTEYAGYNHQSTYECVDASPEYIHGEGANNDGGMFFFTKIQCNRGGHCPPYISNKELTCVVCTK